MSSSQLKRGHDHQALHSSRSKSLSHRRITSPRSRQLLIGTPPSPPPPHYIAFLRTTTLETEKCLTIDEGAKETYRTESSSSPRRVNLLTTNPCCLKKTDEMSMISYPCTPIDSRKYKEEKVVAVVNQQRRANALHL